MIGQISLVWKFRYFWLSLVKLDLKTRYRRSILGIGWSLLNPILMTIVFCLLFSTWQQNKDWKSFAPFFLAGLSIWEFIRSSTLSGCQTFFRNEAYIRQCPLPLAIYPLRTVLGTLIHFMIALGVLLLLISVFTEADHWRAVKMIPVIFPSLVLLIIFCWALSVISGFLTVFFQDSQHLLEVFFQIFFFLTPIMYDNQLLVDRHLKLLATGSPVVIFFDLIREPLLSGNAPPLWLFTKGVIVTFAAMLGALAVIRWLEKKLIFHL